MSSQRECSLDDLLDEIRELEERMKGILPSYIASLRELSQLPDELERRFWASCVEALVGKVKADYQRYQAQAQKAELWGKSVTLVADIILKAGGMEPIPLPDSLRVGISMHPSGKIEPVLMGDMNKPPDTIIVTYEEFTAIGQRFQDRLLKGAIMPASEDEIPKLMYNTFAKGKS
jgi:hypothetical protein